MRIKSVWPCIYTRSIGIDISILNFPKKKCEHIVYLLLVGYLLYHVGIFSDYCNTPSIIYLLCLYTTV
jgi:hypothetical protein